jgi:hypothetical protein
MFLQVGLGEEQEEEDDDDDDNEVFCFVSWRFFFSLCVVSFFFFGGFESVVFCWARKRILIWSNDQKKSLMLFSVFMSFSAVDLVKKNKEQRTAAVVGLKRLKLFFFGQQHSKFSNLVSDDFFFF